MNEVTIDRRCYERFMARFPAKFKDSRGGFGTDVFLRDVSAEGAKIVTKDRLFLNDSVALQVQLSDHFDPMTLRGQVVWLRHHNPSQWEIGLRFFKVHFMGIQRLYKFCEED